MSIQYHALQGAQTYDKYIRDADGHEDVQAFFRECASNDADRAVRCHELLVNLTKDGGIGSA